MDIELRIDRLVVDAHAEDPAQRAALADALTTELGHLLAAPAAWQPAAMATITAPGIKAAGTNESGTGQAESLGRALAYTIYEGIRP